MTFTECQTNNYLEIIMIIDITGTILTPGKNGHECLGNGTYEGIECACDECDYMMCCIESHDPAKCLTCMDRDCPRVSIVNYQNFPLDIA